MGDINLIKKMSFRDLMDDLSSAWRMVGSPESPKIDDDGWVHTINCVFEELKTVGLSAPPKKRGRPKKEPAEQKPKRPRGRPKKSS